jgi:hypothetical protein
MYLLEVKKFRINERVQRVPRDDLLLLPIRNTPPKAMQKRMLEEKLPIIRGTS